MHHYVKIWERIKHWLVITHGTNKPRDLPKDKSLRHQIITLVGTDAANYTARVSIFSWVSTTKGTRVLRLLFIVGFTFQLVSYQL